MELNRLRPTFDPGQRTAICRLAAMWALLLKLCVPSLAEDRQPLHCRIDAQIARAHRGPWAPLADDQEFLRRIYLDVIGRIPTVDEARAFLASSAPDRRSQLIDQLFQSAECNHRLAIAFDLIWMERRADQYVTTAAWRDYLRQSFAENKPYDRLVAEILAADGETQPQRAAAKFLLERDVESHAVTRDVSRLFLGRDVQCAQCHDHPLITDYEQAEYYGIHAFLSRSFRFERTEGDQKVSLIGEKAEGDAEYSSVFFPGEPARTAIPGLIDGLRFARDTVAERVEDAYLIAPADNVRPVPRTSRRAELAERLTNRHSRHFHWNAVNRMWRLMLKQGIVEPPDLIHPDNPPIYPLLLDELADGLVELKYDVKGFLREIALSQAYQRSMELPAELIHPPRDVDEQLGQLRARQASQQETVQRARAAAEQAQAALRQAEQDCLAVRQQTRALIESRNAQRKAIAEHEAKVTEQRAAVQQAQTKAEQIVVLAEQAKTLSDAAPDDGELRESCQVLGARAESARQTRQLLQQQLDELEQALAVQQTGFAATDVEWERLRQVNERAASLVVEQGGAVNGVSRYYRIEQAAQTDLAQQIDFLETMASLRDAETSLQAAHAAAVVAPAALEAAEVAAAEARRKARRSLERRFAVAGIQGLGPETLAASFQTALQLQTRLHAEALGEWKSGHPDVTPEQVEAGQLAAELEPLIVKRQAEIVRPFVELFANSPGSPQDLFQATVDQALFFNNDGRIYGWISPQHGNLTERLLAMADANLLVEELYLSVLSRRPNGPERETALLYLAAATNPDDRRGVIEEMTWSLLASVEFRFQH